jgi:hypothetical protein
MSELPVRDNAWLAGRMQTIWDTYYPDGRKGYPIDVHFGPRARYRYGSIYSVGKQCHILINRLFANPSVPVYVIDATLAHELAHYIHGYGSGLSKLYNHPHRGGVVDKEMQSRGCWFLEERAAEWRKNHWQAFYASQTTEVTERRAAREKQERTRWEMFVSTPGFRTEAQLQARLKELSASFGFEEPPFKVRWLFASVRRNGLSYRFEREESVGVHGVLADPITPQAVIDYEISYWLAVCTGTGSWPSVERSMKQAGIWTAAQAAIHWRRKVWPSYYLEAHPLRTK